MNNPPYILVDVFAEIVQRTFQALSVAPPDGIGLSNLNYQYGYVRELNQRLKDWSKEDKYLAKKYPLVWLRQPFVLNAGIPKGLYGTVELLSFFIIAESSKDLTSAERMAQKFKPTIYPIYHELLKQINQHPAISYDAYPRQHKATDRYFWGEQQLAEISDVVDCMEISEMRIVLNNNSNC